MFDHLGLPVRDLARIRGASVLDPDGHNVEAVCHEFEA
jgi:hypothetical protein